MSRKWLLAMFFITMFCFNPCFSQDTEHGGIKTNTVNINPIALAFSNFAGYYEHLFKMKHGIMFNGIYMFGENEKGYCLQLSYRYHYFKKNKKHDGLNSPFKTYWKRDDVDPYRDSNNTQQYCYATNGVGPRAVREGSWKTLPQLRCFFIIRTSSVQ